ncbi:GDP-mannose 4,6-dehydratase [Aquisalinus flavus]|uniref:UDP-glucose 4-epimerase n=1 Tax=Aquisalinus flavus TaxID=1526572 RepID=A0A8J2V2G0_9PROT|nr:GDP-mannose 4,6-dehydratase [Aquisalinus flavus]MBD0426236.1 GDP-mannose 4,6-dehydratase [Aquisalinus flavus]UNE48192.1 NAD-dependent epimerase/dehydratase family protein [Aquisalinus flavus]GGD09532.1 UDP-glucose 4-epimerase [Aquisalinus flavus]
MAIPSNSRVLVTGAGGFTGTHLLHELRKLDCEIHATGRDTGAGVPATWHTLDLRDEAAVTALVKQVQPDYVFHLAAISFVAHDRPVEIYEVNVLGTENLLKALAQECPDLHKVLVASSANIYGNPATDPVSEETPLAPVNHYGCSKVSMEFIARTYADDVPMVMTRPFNYTGKGQSEKFLVPKMVKHFRERQPTIELGNTDIIRDISDVRDVVQDCLSLAASDSRGESFNLCRGEGVALKEIISILQDVTGHQIEIQVNPAFVRASDIKRLVGDRGKLDGAIGQRDRIAFEETLAWMLEG